MSEEGGHNIENWQIVLAFVVMMGLFGYFYFFTDGKLNEGGAKKESLNDFLGIPSNPPRNSSSENSTPNPIFP